MPKKKRIYLRDLKKIDATTDLCIVRQLEMLVDGVITSPGYTIQFFRDVELYGIDEAILYVKNGNHGDAEKLAVEWERIRIFQLEKRGLVASPPDDPWPPK